MTVTRLPKEENAEANSMPMTPAPMMHRCSGTWSMLSRSVEKPTPDPPKGREVRKGGRAASEPVAMMMFGAVYSSLPMMTVWPSLN